MTALGFEVERLDRCVPLALATLSLAFGVWLRRPDGVCDACPAGGGVTTEEEMFLLLGSYYVQTP